MSDIKDIAESSARQVSPPDWPATSHRAKIALKEEIPSLMLAGEKIPLSLQITNLSDRTWQPDGPDGVELVTRIEPQEPELLTPPEQRWPLSQPLQPDETLSWNRSSNAPRTGGTYLMVWDMARAGDDGLFSEHLGRPPDSARFVIVDMDTVQTILPGLFKRPEDEIIQWLAMVARILPDEPDTALQQSLLNDGLIKGLFQSHLGVRREALYGLHDQYQDHIVASIDSEIERALKHPDNDLEPVLNLSTHPQVKAEARIWLQTLIAQVHPGRLEAHIVEEMARLFADGKFERALALAQSIPDQDIRVTVLLSWAESMAEDDTENQTAQVISLVLDEAASLSEPRKSDIGLRAVGILLSAGELERALTVARSIDDPARRVQALAATETGGGGDTETEGRGDAAAEGGGDTETRRHGGVEMEGRGDAAAEGGGDTETRRRGDAAAEGGGDTETRRRGGVEMEGRGDAETRRRGEAEGVVAFLQVYQPPPEDNILSIAVTPTTVTLTFRGIEYSGPNRIRSQELLEAASDERDYGELLFQGIIHSGRSAGGLSNRTTRDGYAVASNMVAEGNLRIELRLDANDVALHRHRWEFLKDDQAQKPLAVQARYPFYRYQPGPSRDLKLRTDQLGVLVAICNPTTLEQPGNKLMANLKRLTIKDHVDAIETGLARLQDNGSGRYQIINRESGMPASLKNIHRLLKEGDGHGSDYHVLHLLCHGLFIPPLHGDYYLVMEAEDGRHEFVSASQFQTLMSETHLRLVVLEACVSAVTHSSDTLRGLGPALVREGIPAVIAMQDNLPIPTARRFSQYFYDDLARSGQVDMALANTRLSLYSDAWVTEGMAGDWGIPALFMSTRDGKLFDLDVAQVDQSLPQLDREGTAIPMTAGYPERPRRAVTLESAPALDSPSFLMSNLSPSLQVGLASQLAAAAREQPSQPLDSQAPIQRRDLLGRLDLDARITAQGAAGLAGFVSGKGQTVDPRSPQLELPPVIFSQIAAAINTGKHIILIGPPGTGKTSLAKAIADFAGDQGFCTGTTYTTATADWTTFDTVGGYVPAADQTLRFRAGSFLEAIREGRWLIIDEINRAEIDKAFGELFTVLSGQQIDLPYKIDGQSIRVLPPLSNASQQWIPQGAQSGYDYVVHPNWRIVGTMNVYDKSSLFNMSLAFMRRFAFIDVDLPADNLYTTLRNNWINRQGSDGIIFEETHAADLQLLFDSLLNRENVEMPNVLMGRRELGPAIVQDMIQYIRDRYRDRDAATEDMLALAAEACLLYAVPQLDGLDHKGICAIYQELKERFGESAESKGILGRIKALYPYIPEEDWDASS